MTKLYISTYWTTENNCNVVSFKPTFLYLIKFQAKSNQFLEALEN